MKFFRQYRFNFENFSALIKLTWRYLEGVEKAG